MIGTSLDPARRLAVWAWSTTGQFLHKLLHLTVDSIALPDGSAATAITAAIPPVGTSLAVRTITSHMASIATDATDDVGGKVPLLGTIVLAMSNLATVLTSLILIITEGTVESSQLSQLVSLEFVLAFGNRGSCFNNIVHKLLGLVNLLFGICHDQTMEVFFLVTSVSGVRSAFSFFDGAFASNGNLGTRFGLHLLQGISTRTYE